MNIRKLIRDHRELIDAVIEKHMGHKDFPHNDVERLDWVNNSEELYCWAKSQGWNG